MGVLKTLNEVMDEKCIEISEAEYRKEKEIVLQSISDIQASIAKEIQRIMEEKQLGVNEMRRLLGVSPTTFNRLKKGIGNPTIELISSISLISGKIAHIVWR